MAQNPTMAHSLLLAEMLYSQIETGGMTDIVLVCEGKDFPAHKMILSATTNYFRERLSPGGDEPTRIDLPTVTAKEMEVIRLFIYTGKFKEDADQPLLEALLATSHSMQISTLFECCYKKLCEGLNCNRFLEICNLAFHYSDEGMTTHVVTFLAQHFEEAAESEEFKKLSALQMTMLCQHPDTLKVSKDIIIDRLFRWTEVDEEREKTLLQILATLDLHNMSTNFLSKNLHERPLVKKNHHLLTLLTAEAMSRMLTLASKILVSNNDSKLLIFGTNGNQHVFRMYDIKLNEWSLLRVLPFTLEDDPSMVWFDGYVNVMGGSSAPTKVIKYCPATNAFSSFGTLSDPVRLAGAGAVDGYIYIVSGYNDSRRQWVTTVQRYDPVTGTCKMVAETNNTHRQSHVLPFGKELLVIGAYDNSVERYDPIANTWTVVSTIPGNINLCSAAIYEEKLYVVPVYETSEFQIYDFISDTWEKKVFEGSPAKIRRLHSTLVEGKCILLVRDDKDVFHSLDPLSNQWNTMSSSNGEPQSIMHTCIV